MVEKSKQRWTVLALLALGFASGGIAVAYEVVWTRELLNLLGSTTAASAATLAAFMAGIAVGSWLAGRVSELVGEPLWLFVGAEGLLAGFGLSFSAMLGVLADTLPSNVSAVALIVVLLLLPTFLMGIALPTLAAALQGEGAAHPRFIAWLYGLNTLGGAAVGLGVGFGALPAFGLAATSKATAISGLFVAVVALVLAQRRSHAGIHTIEFEQPTSSGSAGFRTSALLASLFLSGIAALGYEVVWTRTLVLVVGSSTNAFTLMLGLYLLGLSIGGFWIGRYVGSLTRPEIAFQHLQLGVMAAAIAGVALFEFLPGLALYGLAELGISPASIALVNGTIAAIIILPPAVMIGASLPVAARLLQGPTSRRGRELGTALALITAGNVVGVLATAFGVIPAVGLQHGIMVLASFNLAAAVVLWIANSRSSGRRGFVVPTVAVSAVLIVPLIPSWDRVIMTSGVFRQAPIYLALLGGADRLERAFAAYRTVYYREGSEAVVAVFDRPTLPGPAHRVLTIDGKVDASTGRDMATQLLSGHLPMLFRPDARNALVIGLASGVTVGALAQYPLQQIDVVEIEPAVVDASRAFDHVSGAPLRDPRVSLTIGDGRRYLRATSRRYDVIVSEPSNPWLSMSARLFTREFFEMARDRLVAQGVLVQWIPLYGLSTRQFESLLRTLLRIFPHLSVFHVAEGDLLALASMAPLTVHPAVLDNIFGGPSRSALERLGINSSADIVAQWVADAHGLRSVLGSGPLNTDDNGLLEFGSPWFILNDATPANLSTVFRASETAQFFKDVVTAWPSSVDSSEFLENIAARHLANGRTELVRRLALELRAQNRSADADLLLGDATAAEGKWREAERIWHRHDAPAFLMRRAKVLFRMGRVEQTAQIFGRVPSQLRTPEDNIIYALALSATGRTDDALNTLKEGLSAADTAAGILASFVRAALYAELGKTDPAARERRVFEARLDSLRRCLELDRCREEIDSLHSWSRFAPPGMSNRKWEDFRQTLYVRVTRPLPIYIRAVTQLWLGERITARKLLKTYLKILPEPDALSRAHELL